MAGGFFFLGMFVYVCGGLWMFQRASEHGCLWAIAMFIPPLSFLFMLRHWEDARGPFFTQLAGMAIMVIGMVFA